MHYEPVKVTIDFPGLVKVILVMVIWHYGLPNSIALDRGLLFTIQFWLLLCYFFGIKRRLYIGFHPQTDGQTKYQNNTIEIYNQDFVTFEQND